MILTGVVAWIVSASGRADGGASPIDLTKIPSGCRDWRLISVARQEGEWNGIRAILGHDAAIQPYREGKLPLPEGTTLAGIAWNYAPSEENNKVFGGAQSFVPGAAPGWYLQFMVKGSHKYAATAVGDLLNLIWTASLQVQRR